MVLLSNQAGGVGGCVGTLITPRLVLTAWHCVGDEVQRRSRANFGQTLPTTDELRIDAIDCQVFPGARTDGVAPTCLNFPYLVGAPTYDGYTAELREPFDLAVIVLEERVDATNRADGPTALPMAPALDDPASNPVGWTGQMVRLVGRTGRGGEQRVTTSERPILGLRFAGSGLRIEHTPLSGGRGEEGDSGGPWVWQPAGTAPRVVSVFNLDPRLAHPEIAAWLRPLVEPSGELDAYVGDVYVGPTDVPSVDNPARLDDPTGYDAVDPDGDGLVGLHDNCPGLRNIDQADFDGDGIGDACDADGDRILDTDDNCRTDPNPLQEDCDDDRTGDACEADSDHDVVPDDCDNCPRTWNPDQAVCNEDTPQLDPTNGLPMGTACAPTPCADVNPIVTTSDGGLGASEVRNDDLEGAAFVTHLTEVTAEPRPGCTISELRQTGEGSGAVTTGLRWCPCDARVDSPDQREVCEALSGCTRSASAYPIEPDPTARTWRAMNVDFTRPRPIFFPIADEVALRHVSYPTTTRAALDVTSGTSNCSPSDLLERMAMPAPVPVLEGRWDFLADAAREGIPVIRRGTAFSTEDALRVVNWAHSLRYDRCDVPPCRGNGGTAPPSSAPLESRGAGSDQASHYWSGETVVRTFTSGREPDIDPLIPARIPFPDICWFCADAFPSLWLGHRECVSPGCAPRWVARGVGADVPVNELMTQGAHVALTQMGLRWVAARELDPHLAPGATLFVGIDGARQVIARLAITDAGTLGLAEEKGDPLPPPQSQAPIAPPDVAFPQRSGRRWIDAPCASRGALLLLGNEHLLVGIGGEGADADRITFTDLADGTVRSELLSGPVPRRVLAAAMHIRRMEALVLDEIAVPRRRGPPRRFARFLAIDLQRGESRELARHPRLGVFDRHALVGTADGGFALASTNDRAGQTWVFGLAVDGSGLVLTGARHVRGRLLGPPVASRRGISLPVSDRRLGWEPVAIRPGDLRRCTPDELRATM